MDEFKDVGLQPRQVDDVIVTAREFHLHDEFERGFRLLSSWHDHSLEGFASTCV